MAEKDKKASQEKRGRPTIMTEAVIKKLEEGFSYGLSDIEACLFAGISKQTLYSYQEKNPDFRDRKEQLKNTLLMNSKMNIALDIRNGDVDTSKWYAERKSRKEFSTRVDLTSDDQAITPSLEVNFVAAGKKTEDKGE